MTMKGLAKGTRRLMGILLGAAGTCAPAISAKAAPYLTVDLLGRVQGSGQPFSSSVTTAPGDKVDYVLRFQLAPEGTQNAYASTASLRTITNWVPSLPSGQSGPTSGLVAITFSLAQSATPNTIQSDFTTQLVTGDDGHWDDVPSFDPGNITPRGNGAHNLERIFISRNAGEFSGIIANPSPPPDELQRVMDIASGNFSIVSGGKPSKVNIDFTGFGQAVTFVGIRWRNASNTASVNFTPTIAMLNNSIANNDPLIKFNSLTLLPEPATGGVITGAGVLATHRRRKEKRQ
jgi:hypothetical protein